MGLPILYLPATLLVEIPFPQLPPHMLLQWTEESHLDTTKWHLLSLLLCETLQPFHLLSPQGLKGKRTLANVAQAQSQNPPKTPRISHFHQFEKPIQFWWSRSEQPARGDSTYMVAEPQSTLLLWLLNAAPYTALRDQTRAGTWQGSEWDSGL